MKALDSWKYSLLSECPNITYFTPISFNITGDISPVYAPESFGCMFCAAIATFDPSTVFTADSKAVNGAPITISTPSTPFVNSFNSDNVAFVSATVLFIFQFPAIIVFLIDFSLQNFFINFNFIIT